MRQSSSLAIHVKVVTLVKSWTDATFRLWVQKPLCRMPPLCRQRSALGDQNTNITHGRVSHDRDWHRVEWFSPYITTYIMLSFCIYYIYYIHYLQYFTLYVLCCRRESSVLLRFGSSLGGGWSTKVLPEAMWPWALWETSSNLNVAKAGKDEQIQENELNTFLGWFQSKSSRRMTIHPKHNPGQLLSSMYLFQLIFHLTPFSNFHMYLTPAILAVLWNRIFHLFVFESFWAFYGVLPVFSWCSLGFWLSPLPYLSTQVHSTRPPLARGWRGVFPRLQAEKKMNETSVGSVVWCLLYLLSTGVFTTSVSKVKCSA